MTASIKTQSLNDASKEKAVIFEEEKMKQRKQIHEQNIVQVWLLQTKNYNIAELETANQSHLQMSYEIMDEYMDAKKVAASGSSNIKVHCTKLIGYGHDLERKVL